jgi:hypothetical protein
MEIWQMLRMACEADSIETAQAILDSENITCPTGKLTDGAYDPSGGFYQIPDYCLGVLNITDEELGTEMSLVNLKTTEKMPSVLSLTDSFPIKVRLSSGADISVEVVPQMKISRLAKLIAEKINLDPQMSKNIKMIYLGKNLSPNMTIEDTQMKENTYLQAFIAAI